MTEQKKPGLPGLDFLIFSQRRELEKAYLEWVAKENVKDCPMSVIGFLVGHDLINTEKAIEFIKNGGENG